MNYQKRRTKGKTERGKVDKEKGKREGEELKHHKDTGMPPGIASAPVVLPFRKGSLCTEFKIVPAMITRR
jgi:hypothetical protein